ncbi:MAG: mechanosensitive ion channel [Asgard group archaeon]|nr:mechanosensitive ion channel [Asgard group archaeon]
MKITNHLKKISKRRIIYGFLFSLFIILLIMYIYSRFAEGNFIERLANITHEEYKLFLKAYIDSFFIYSISAIIILVILNFIMHALEEKVSPDIHNTLHVLTRVIVIPFFIIAYLNRFEAYSGAIIGVAAILGGALGIAAALSINELVTGVSMVFSKHHNVGDYLLIPNMGIEGIVNEISIRYLTILQPDRTIAVIPNKKLRDSEIINIKVTKTEKDRDGITDFLLYGRRVTETQYVYPLKWAVNSEDSHNDCVKAIKKTVPQFKDFLENDEADWQIIERNRLDRRYAVLLTVLDPTILLELKDDFTEALETIYEKIKNK